MVSSGSQGYEKPAEDVSAEFLLKKMEAYEYCLDYFLNKVQAKSEEQSIVPQSSDGNQDHAMLEQAYKD
jgi:hypothetical protein